MDRSFTRQPQVKARYTICTAIMTWCLPMGISNSHATLAGLPAETTGIYKLAPNHWDAAMDRDVVRLSQYVESHGYRALSKGKIFHGTGTMSEKRVEFEEWRPIGTKRIDQVGE